MNNVDALTELLTASPDDDITAYLLTDALMEERDMTRSEASRVVLHVRLAGYEARDLALAAEAIRPDSPDRSRCLSLIRAACSTQPPVGANVVLVPGAKKPHAVCEYRSNPGAWWYDWTVTVGASWLLSALALRVIRDRMAEQKRARKRSEK